VRAGAVVRKTHFLFLFLDFYSPVVPVDGAKEKMEPVAQAHFFFSFILALVILAASSFE